MKATPIVPVDFGARQIIPLDQAVSTAALPRFRLRDHARSALVREILDQFAHEAARRYAAVPAPAPDQNCESIVMEGAEIRRTLRTGAFEVRQNSTAALEVDDTPAPLAFETVADSSIQSAAAVALQQLNDRPPHARRGHRLPRKPDPKAPRTAGTGAMITVFVLAALAILGLLCVVNGWRL